MFITTQATTTILQQTNTFQSLFDASHFATFKEWYKTENNGMEPSSSLAIFLAPGDAPLASTCTVLAHDSDDGSDDDDSDDDEVTTMEDEPMECFDHGNKVEASMMELCGLVNNLPSPESEMDEDKDHMEVDRPEIVWMDDKDEMEIDIPEIVWMDDDKDEMELDLPETNWMIVDGDDMEVDGP
ncbi:MAG: hypothetical protein SGBAC_007155 [Bacillariaceae sp.]